MKIFKQILALDKEEMSKRMSKAEEQFYWRLDERDLKDGVISKTL